MKKLFFTLAVALGAFVSVNAQDVGQMWVGGSVGFWSSKVKGADESQTSYKILPEFGYVVSDNIGIGVNLGYAHAEGQLTTLDNAGNAIYGGEQEGFVIAPFLRYSFLKGDLGALFLDGGVGYTHMKDKDFDTKAHMLEVGFRPGVAVNVSDKISLTGKFGFIGYQNEKSEVASTNANGEKTKSDVKTNSFGIDLDMRQVLLGVSLKF